MEWWSNGLITQHSSIPVFQYSNTPTPHSLDFPRPHLRDRNFRIPVEIRALASLRDENVEQIGLAVARRLNRTLQRRRDGVGIANDLALDVVGFGDLGEVHIRI